MKLNLPLVKALITPVAVRLTPTQAAAVRFEPVGLLVIGIGPFVIVSNLPKRFWKKPSPIGSVVSIDEINKRARAASTDT